jgi:hypothetical protein
MHSFKGASTLFGLQNAEKCFEKALGKVGSAFQNLRLGEHKLYPSQTKILERMTKEEIRIFEALFNGS